MLQPAALSLILVVAVGLLYAVRGASVRVDDHEIGCRCRQIDAGGGPRVHAGGDGGCRRVRERAEARARAARAVVVDGDRQIRPSCPSYEQIDVDPGQRVSGGVGSRRERLRMVIRKRPGCTRVVLPDRADQRGRGLRLGGPREPCEPRQRDDERGRKAQCSLYSGRAARSRHAPLRCADRRRLRTVISERAAARGASGLVASVGMHVVVFLDLSWLVGLRWWYRTGCIHGRFAFMHRSSSGAQRSAARPPR